MLLLSRTVEERNGRRLQGYGDSGAPDTADGRRRIGLSVQNNDKDARKIMMEIVLTYLSYIIKHSIYVNRPNCFL